MLTRTDCLARSLLLSVPSIAFPMVGSDGKLQTPPPTDLMGSAQAPLAIVRFGAFEADLRAGELRRNGVRIRLQDLPFRALTLLLSRPGEVITREEFRQALWPPNIFVDFEQGISSAVMRLRDALRDSADNPIFIETIERRGYRWIGPIQRVDPVASESQEKESPEKQATAGATPLPSKPSPWRKLVYVIPVLAILFAAWIFRPGFRDTKASAKSNPAPARTPHQPANREAEDFYLTGRFYWNKRTPESLNQVLEAFTQAIAHDPNYSDAYVGLADCYNLLREFSAMSGNEAYFKAFAAAKKAVELDPQSSEAHASLAFATFLECGTLPTAKRNSGAPLNSIRITPRHTTGTRRFCMPFVATMKP